MTKPAILFVCLGNICRSPMAEGAFRAEAEKRGLDVTIDSAGIGGWHEGEAPDKRARDTAKRHGVDIDNLRARKIRRDDFERFTLILALDGEVFAELNHRKPDGAPTAVRMLMDFVAGREGQSVPDPYYGEASGFESSWADVSAAAVGLADALEKG